MDRGVFKVALGRDTRRLGITQSARCHAERAAGGDHAKPPRSVSLDAAPFALVGRICRACKGPRTRGASHNSINSGPVLGFKVSGRSTTTPLPFPPHPKLTMGMGTAARHSLQQRLWAAGCGTSFRHQGRYLPLPVIYRNKKNENSSQPTNLSKGSIRSSPGCVVCARSMPPPLLTPCTPVSKTTAVPPAGDEGRLSSACP
jgi:hypothetical protein